MPFKNVYEKRKYQKNYQAKWRIKNKSRWAKIQQKYDQKRNKTLTRKKQQHSAHSRKHHRNKLKVLKMYGGKCEFCGINYYEVLTVDHIKNNGNKHRHSKRYKKYGNIFRYLVDAPFRPDLYRILCYNCNSAKQHYNIEPGKKSYKSLSYWENISKLRKFN